MYIDRVRRHADTISNDALDAKGSNRAAPAQSKPGTGGWRSVTESQPFNVTINDAPISPWRLPDSYKKVKASGSALEDDADTVIISDVPPETRSKTPDGTVVKTPHSILHSPLDFLPILFRHARLLEHAMSVLEILNPTLAANRRKLLCHCGEGFPDPESAATAIAVEDRSAPPRRTADAEAMVPAGADIGDAPPMPDHSVLKRPVSAPLNIHRRRPNWLRTHGVTSS